MRSRTIPLLLVILAIALFAAVTYPGYTKVCPADEEKCLDGVQKLQERHRENEQTILLAAQLAEKKAELVKKYDKIDDNERALLAKLLPTTVDNVRLVNEIYAMAGKQGRSVAIQNVAVGSEAQAEEKGKRTAAVDVASRSRTYGVLPVAFSARASYGDFEAFLRDLEMSRRIVDVRSISLKTTPTGEYDWTVQLDTYWLR